LAQAILAQAVLVQAFLLKPFPSNLLLTVTEAAF